MINKFLTVFLLVFVSNLHASDWAIEKIISDFVGNCENMNGVFYQYKIKNENENENKQEKCFIYKCAGEYKSKLKIGHDTFKIHDQNILLTGQHCVSQKTDIDYSTERFEKLKYLDYFKCYSKCSDNSSIKECLECLSDKEAYAQCTMSEDFNYVECPFNKLYKIEHNINQTLKSIVDKYIK